MRPMACSLMHNAWQTGDSTSNLQRNMVSALRHAAWLISRFSVIRGVTAFELSWRKVLAGELYEFCELVFGCVVPETN